ncbi:MAG: hypothetical protein U0794_06075 [Isosphaeraceae bacterium]
MSPLRLSAVTSQERHGVTFLVRRAVSQAGGGITEFRRFSNFAVVFEIEIAAARLPDLYAAVGAAGIVVEPPLDALPPSETAELTVSLRLLFDHNEPDLSLVVPAVPG